MTYDPHEQEIYLGRLQDSRKAYSGLGLAVAVLFGVYLVTSYALMYFVAYCFPAIYSQWWFQWVLNLVPLYCFALPAFYLCLRRVDKGAHDPCYVSRSLVYEKPRFHFGHWCLFAIMGFGLMYIGSFIGDGLMTWLSDLMGYDYQNGLSDMADTSPWWMLLLGSVIIAPIGEEFLFRKLFIDRARRYGDGMAILLSALLFALFHANFFQFFYAFFVGMIMAYLYTLTGKLYWSVGLHMFVNFMGMMVIPNVLKWLGLEEMETIDAENLEAVEEYIAAHVGEYAVLMLINGLIYCAMAAAVALVIYHFCTRKVYLGHGECPIRREDRAIAAFCNVGIPLCIFLLCLMMVMNLIPPPAGG